MTPTPTTCACGADADHRCEQCGRAECLRCYSRYEVPVAPPRLCWQCQAEADQEWLQTDLSQPPRRWPREGAALR